MIGSATEAEADLIRRVLCNAERGYKGVAFQAHVRSDAPNVVEVVADIRQQQYGGRSKSCRIERICHFYRSEFASGIDGESASRAIQRRMLFDQWCYDYFYAPLGERVIAACCYGIVVAITGTVSVLDGDRRDPSFLDLYNWRTESGEVIEPLTVQAWMFWPRPSEGEVDQ